MGLYDTPQSVGAGVPGVPRVAAPVAGVAPGPVDPMGAFAGLNPAGSLPSLLKPTVVAPGVGAGVPAVQPQAEHALRQALLHRMHLTQVD